MSCVLNKLNMTALLSAISHSERVLVEACLFTIADLAQVTVLDPQNPELLFI
jgi:hypothetical protein